MSDISLEYENYLAVARKEKFDDIAPLNFLYQSGKDSLGRPIIVMIGAQLPAKKIDLERVMLYAISVMDHVVESEYVMVYAHTNMSSENRPNFAWLRKMYSIFNRKYKKNLKQLYIVHPTVWVKMTFRLFKPFLSSKFWRKLVYVDQSADIWNYFQKDQITLPNYVLNYGAPPKKAQPIFGVSLEDIVTRPENNLHYTGTREIPLIVDDTVKYLREKAMNVEGIFRISGGNSQLKELRKSYDSGEEVDLNDVEDPHIVAGLLKLYLRELPVPLLVNCHSALLNCHDLPSEEEQINYLKAIMSSLPKVHQVTAKHLFTFWFDVTQHSAENRMTPVNLSIVTAPNVVRNPSETIESSLRDTPPINSVVALLIQHADKIL